MSGPRRPAGGQVRPREVGGIRSGRFDPRSAGGEGSRVVRGRGVRQAGGDGGGRFGWLRFLIFAVGLAATVVVLLLAIAGPAIGDAFRDLASRNPEALRLPFVADIVRNELGSDLAEPAGTDPTEIRFEVVRGSTAVEIGAQLEEAGLLRDGLAFTFLVVTQGLAGEIEAGTYKLRATMTPAEIVKRLQQAPIVTVTVPLREGLRVEQVAAKLLTLPLEMDVARFYRLVQHPSESLLADYPWIGLPAGRSLEGYLAPATYEVEPDIEPEALLRLMLDLFHDKIGQETLDEITAQGGSLYEILTLASIVELETALDDERPLIAGVYQNRLDREMLLNADPTVLYARDTVELEKVTLSDWVSYYFWNRLDVPLAEYQVPEALQGYQTYQVRGLIPGPICTPTRPSIAAALAPDTETGFLYFVAIPDGGGRHAFAKTLEEHEANLKKYGYL